RSVGSPVPTHTISVSLGAIATAPIDCTGCLSKVESKVTPLSPVLNKPPVESPTKKIAGLRGSIAISETRPPIAAGPIDSALIVFTALYFGRTEPFVDSVGREKTVGEKLLRTISFLW